MNLLQQVLENTHAGPFPIISTSPMQHEPLVGLHQEDARTAAWIEDDLVRLLQEVEPRPAERFFQHKTNDEGRRVDRSCSVFNEELVDVTDKLYGQIFERVELPQGQLPRFLLPAFHHAREAYQLTIAFECFAVNVVKNEYVAVEPLF